MTLRDTAEVPLSGASRRRLRSRRSAAATADRRRGGAALVDPSLLRSKDDEINALRAERSAEREALARARGELEEMRRIYDTDRRMHAQLAEAHRRENKGLKEEIEALTRDMNAEAYIAEYADVMKNEGEALENSAKLQSELCKALHNIEVLNDRLQIEKRSCDDRVKYLGGEMIELAKEKGEVESNLKKEISALQEAKRVTDEAHEEDLRKKQAQINNLIAQLEEVQSGASGLRGGDCLGAMNAMKEQLNTMAKQKEASERDLNRKLKNRDETIALLQEVNAVNEEHLELLREENETDESTADGSEGSITVVSSMSTVSEQNESNASKSSDRSGSVAALSVLMGSMAKVTGNLEGDVMASIRRKRQLLSSLDCDDSISVVSFDQSGDGCTRGGAGSPRPSLVSVSGARYLSSRSLMA